MSSKLQGYNKIKQGKKIKRVEGNSSKGFLFTVEAVVVFLVLIFLFYHSFSFSRVDLNNELMFMQVQDIVEACSLKKDYTENCIKQVEEVNPHIKISCISFSKSIKKCFNPLIDRDYIQVSAELT